MFRRILIPVDAGPGSIAAARLAARLAKSRKGRLHACYVVDRAVVHGHGTFLAVRDRLRRELQGEGRRVLNRVKAVCRRLRVPCSGTLAEGDVTAELVKAARRSRAQLIVMGTRGLGRVGALLRGSVAQQLVAQAPCPVLLVRHRAARRVGASRRAKKRAGRR